MNSKWMGTVACVLALMWLAGAALAESTARTRVRNQMTRFNVDRTAYSADQLAAYDKALSDYATAEDQALASLVASGDVEQQRVAQFQRMRDTQAAIASGDTEAFRGRGNADGGQTPEGLDPQNLPEGFDPENLPEGFDAGNMPEGFDPGNMPEGFDPGNMPEGFDPGNMPEGTDGRRGGGNATDIWAEISNLAQTEAVQGALSAIQQAQQQFLTALSEAGVALQTSSN